MSIKSRIAIAIAVALQVLCSRCAGAALRRLSAKPIRMIVPFAPGGPPDVIGRPIVQKLSEILGQPSSSTTGPAPRA
jgi:tripartite-type tricarboxylate transporter receptor subunit TctC